MSVNDPVIAICCGILKPEITALVHKNQWPIKLIFLDSTLHINFNKLSKQLTKTLENQQDHKCMLIYGACHPLLNKILTKYRAIRTPSQNCISMLLGNQRFETLLKEGAFFLLEDWAKRWDIISQCVFRSNEIAKDILHLSHSHFMAIRTPFSSDFSKEALHVSNSIGLPLYWLETDLKHLESIIEKTMKDLN